MFDKLKNRTIGGATKNAAPLAIEKALAEREQSIELAERIQRVNAKTLALSTSESMDLKKIMDMIGTLGSDGAINESIVDNMKFMLGNNPDPVQMTKYFSGMIAQRVLTLADVRKIPGNLFASRGGVPLDITSSLVYCQPVHLFGAASLIQPARFQQKPLNIAFDANSEITVGPDTFDNYVTNTVGTYAAPFVAHLFILKRNDTLRGDSKFFVRSEYRYEAGIQLTDDTAAVLLINHKKAIKVTSDQTLVVATPPDLVVDLGFGSEDLDEQFEITTTVPMDVTVTGTNVSITHYQLPMYTPIAEAILAALISGRLDMLPVWMLNNLSAQIKF